MKLTRIITSFVLLIFIFQCQTVSAEDAEKNNPPTHRKMLKGYSSGWKVEKKKNRYTEKQAGYSVPEVNLLDQEGKTVYLPELLSSSEPYALNFIFATCTTVCPIMTVTLLSMQKELGTEGDSLKLISITIDPEHDTPKVLNEYARQMGAGKNWTFLTGDYDTVVVVEKAFDGYSADKMNHKPFTLFKTGKSPEWTRVDGLAGGADLAKVYRDLLNLKK